MSFNDRAVKATNSITKILAIAVIGFSFVAASALAQNTTFPGSVIVANGFDVEWGNTSSRIIGLAGSSGFLNIVTNSATRMFIDASGTVTMGGSLGVGSAAPVRKLDVDGYLAVSNNGAVEVYNTAISTGNFEKFLIAFSGNKGKIISSSGGTGTLRPIQITTGGAVGLNVDVSGFVRIGTTTPTQVLDIAGNVNVSGNIAAKYQDVAEWVAATETMEPGTVVVLNPEKPNEVMPSIRSYDTAVAGIVSANPGLILGEPAKSKAQIATSGRVRVKAIATSQPIHIGDLLVTSGKRGMAMKSEPIEIGARSFHQPGTIIGKALEPLSNGEGEILVLLSLQ